MRLHFWGTRGSIVSPGPSTRRYGGNTACVEVIGYSGAEPGGALAHKNAHLILDGGTGITALQPTLLRGPWGKGKGELHILLTHYHWDHLIGLPFFAPMFFKGNRVVFYGANVEDLQSSIAKLFTSIYSPIKGTKNLSAKIEYKGLERQGMEIGGFEVQAVETNHPATTLAYRIDYEGSSVIYATDHETGNKDRDDELVSLAKGGDTLILDAQFTEEQLQEYPGYGHSSHLKAVALARRAEVKELVLFHHNPKHDDSILDKMGREAAKQVDGQEMKVSVARDGMALLLGVRARS